MWNSLKQKCQITFGQQFSLRKNGNKFLYIRIMLDFQRIYIVIVSIIDNLVPKPQYYLDCPVWFLQKLV